MSAKAVWFFSTCKLDKFFAIYVSMAERLGAVHKWRSQSGGSGVCPVRTRGEGFKNNVWQFCVTSYMDLTLRTASGLEFRSRPTKCDTALQMVRQCFSLQRIRK